MFYQSFLVRLLADGFECEIINVYGPVQDDKKMDFLEEINSKIQSSQKPLLVGGDFNLVRKISEKSCGLVDHRFMDAFNEMIDVVELRELFRGGCKYTWTNKQLSQVQCVLDRILINNSWKDSFNLSSVKPILRVGFDHTSLLCETEHDTNRPLRYFRFDPKWLTQEGFGDWEQKMAFQIQEKLY